MPLPTPNAGEDRQAFISRCMEHETAKGEFKDQKQRLAVCFSQWRKAKMKRAMKIGPLRQLKKLSEKDRVIAGYASTAIVDEQDDLIPIETQKYMWDRFYAGEFQIITLAHNDLPIGKVIPEYTDSKGIIHKSGVDDHGTYVVSKLRTDTKAAEDAWNEIERWGTGAYSISAVVTGDPVIQYTNDGRKYNRYDPGTLELSSIAIGKDGANAEAIFQIVKLKKAKRRLVVKN